MVLASSLRHPSLSTLFALGAYFKAVTREAEGRWRLRVFDPLSHDENRGVVECELSEGLQEKMTIDTKNYKKNVPLIVSSWSCGMRYMRCHTRYEPGWLTFNPQLQGETRPIL